MKLEQEIKDIVKDEEKAQELIELFERKLTKKMKKFASSLKVIDEVNDGSVETAINEIRYSVMEQALYPTEMTLMFDKDDFKEIVKELGEPGDKVVTVKTDYGPVHLTTL